MNIKQLIPGKWYGAKSWQQNSFARFEYTNVKGYFYFKESYISKKYFKVDHEEYWVPDIDYFEISQDILDQILPYKKEKYYEIY